jgi:hypothetical protein
MNIIVERYSRFMIQMRLSCKRRKYGLTNFLQSYKILNQKYLPQRHQDTKDIFFMLFLGLGALVA